MPGSYTAYSLRALQFCSQLNIYLIALCCVGFFTGVSALIAFFSVDIYEEAFWATFSTAWVLVLARLAWKKHYKVHIGLLSIAQIAVYVICCLTCIVVFSPYIILGRGTVSIWVFFTGLWLVGILYEYWAHRAGRQTVGGGADAYQEIAQPISSQGSNEGASDLEFDGSWWPQFVTISSWTLRWAALIFLTAFMIGTAYETLGEIADRNAYPVPGYLYDIDDAAPLHIYCVGQGSPTVIFDSGRGEDSLQWRRIQEEISSKATACAYDRAGYGWSTQLGPTSRTAPRLANELRELLEEADAPKPYVLVGHELGGFNMRMFATAFRDEGIVAGMVLVNSAHEDQAERYESLREYQRSDWEDQLSSLRGTRVLSVVGFVRLGFYYDVYEADSELPRNLQQQQQSHMSSPIYVTTLYRESKVFRESASYVRDTRQNYGAGIGDIPLQIVAAGGQPNEAMRSAWLELQEDLLLLAGNETNPVLTVAPSSDGRVHLHEPGLVVSAIEAVLEAVGAANGTEGGAKE